MQDIQNYKKISVLGPTGSGKSFVSGKLSKILDLPIIYFDHYTWNPDRSPIDKNIFVENVLSMAGDKWVMDGNHSRDDELTKHRFTQSDLIVFLDFNEKDCAEAVKLRSGTARPDIPDYLIEDDNDTAWLINHIKKWFDDNKPQLILAQAEKYEAKEKFVTLKNRQQVDDFLSLLKKQFGSGDRI
ncbi:MAG: hypothetical protein FWE45_01700 [Firmicutes bacterium]|nr:hypothetical protein [Bacillota bacterium]